jgi:hypothetical protein
MKMLGLCRQNNKRASMMRAITVAVVSGIMLLASWENVANARVSGYVPRNVAPGHIGPHHNHVFRRGPLWGGFVTVPVYPSYDSFGYPPDAPFAPDGSAAVTDYPGDRAAVQRCQNPTQRTVTVPSEAGGTKQITVTYCHP